MNNQFNVFIRTSKQLNETTKTFAVSSKHMKLPDRRTLVALKLPARVGLLLVFVRFVVRAMDGNQYFPKPSPPLTKVSLAASDLERAQSAVDARNRGAYVQRDLKRAALVLLMQGLALYVQSIADADPRNAAIIIESAGMSVRKVNTHGQRVFAVKQAPASGSVDVVAPSAARRASYDWQWSTDGGKTWHAAASTVKASTTLSGFVAGTVVCIRYRANVNAREGQWSNPVALLVH